MTDLLTWYNFNEHGSAVLLCLCHTGIVQCMSYLSLILFYILVYIDYFRYYCDQQAFSQIWTVSMLRMALEVCVSFSSTLTLTRPGPPLLSKLLTESILENVGWPLLLFILTVNSYVDNLDGLNYLITKCFVHHSSKIFLPLSTTTNSRLKKQPDLS